MERGGEEETEANVGDRSDFYTLNFPILYFLSISCAALLCPISSKSSVASLPAQAGSHVQHPLRL